MTLWQIIRFLSSVVVATAMAEDLDVIITFLSTSVEEEEEEEEEEEDAQESISP